MGLRVVSPTEQAIHEVVSAYIQRELPGLCPIEGIAADIAIEVVKSEVFKNLVTALEEIAGWRCSHPEHHRFPDPPCGRHLPSWVAADALGIPR